MKSFSPSTSPRWVPCPGSAALNENVPYTSSEPARVGTGVHAVIEWALNKQFRNLIFDAMPETFCFEYQHALSDLAITPEIVEHVNVMLDTVYAAAESMQREDGGRMPRILIEFAIDLSPVHPLMVGRSQPFRLDVALIGQYRAVVIDYKNGYVPVRLYDDGDIYEQMICYALGVHFQFNGLLDVFDLVIVQPKNTDAGPVQKTTITLKDIDNYLRVMRLAVETASKPNAPLAVGPWCRFCAAKPVCPEQKRHAESLMSSEFEKYAQTGEALTTGFDLNKCLTDDDLAKVLEGVAFARLWFEAVEEHAVMKMRQGAQFPRHKMVRGKGSRVWIDGDPVQALVNEGVFLDEIYEPKTLRSPHAIEELGPKQKAAVAKLARKVPGRLVLAHESDNRQAVDPLIISEFKDYAN